MRRARLATTALVAFGAATFIAYAFAADARASCENVKSAPMADSDHPSTELVAGVWQRVYNVFGALTGRATSLVVLAESARLPDGKPFAPSAFICPAPVGDTPIIYVTWPLIMRAQSDALYDVDFIALVVGHELGHRVRDLTFEGQRQTASGGPEIEGRADLHGAFFAALAGYSTRRLACDAALDTFLDVEAHVGESARAKRREKLAEALRAFDVYESLYEVSTGLLFGDVPLARKLTSWVDKHLSRRLEPIPEFKVLQALALLADIAPTSPASRLIAIDDYASAAHLKCSVVFPQHTAFFDDLLAQANAPDKLVVRDGTTEIRTAIGLLREAERLGASPLAVRSALACAEAHLGDTTKAKGELEAARKFAAGRHPAVLAALDANAAFIDWVAWMTAHPAPNKASSDSERKAWAKLASGQASTVKSHRTLASWVAGLATFPKLPTADKAAPMTCNVKPAATTPASGWARFPTPPKRPSGVAGGCPCGWLELHFLDDDMSRSDPNDGVRTCVPAGWGTGLRWVDMRLPMGGVDLTSMLVEGGDAFTGSLGNLERWHKTCDSLTHEGTSDRGLTTWRGVCPALNAQSVVLFADDCQVRKALVRVQ